MLEINFSTLVCYGVTELYCLVSITQEVDRFQELEEELKLRGYSGIWKVCTLVLYSRKDQEEKLSALFNQVC